MRLGPALDPDRFSEAERSALLLDGDCRPLGLTVVPLDEPDTAGTRAASLASAVRRYDLVVDRRSAAWVHGATTTLPGRLTLAIDVDRSRRTKLLVPAPREARFRAEDLRRISGVLVTAPLKTAFDLLRLDEDAEAEALAAALIHGAGLTPTIAAALAHLHPGCPNKERGITRLAALRA